MNDIEKLEAERLEWSLKTFPQATPESSLFKCGDELKEIQADIRNGIRQPLEYADALMCLFDSAGRQNPPILPAEIFEAFAVKLAINKKRNWVKNDNNTYSHILPPKPQEQE